MLTARASIADCELDVPRKRGWATFTGPKHLFIVGHKLIESRSALLMLLVTHCSTSPSHRQRTDPGPRYLVESRLEGRLRGAREDCRIDVMLLPNERLATIQYISRQAIIGFFWSLKSDAHLMGGARPRVGF